MHGTQGDVAHDRPVRRSANGGQVMSSDASPVEELLDRWVKRNPASPVRAVVQRAEALGFRPALPGGRRPQHLELVLGDTTLHVTPLQLTVADPGVRGLAAGLPGAVATADDVQ